MLPVDMHLVEDNMGSPLVEDIYLDLVDNNLVGMHPEADMLPVALVVTDTSQDLEDNSLVGTFPVAEVGMLLVELLFVELADRLVELGLVVELG